VIGVHKKIIKKTNLELFEDFLDLKICQAKRYLAESLITHPQLIKWWSDLMSGLETALKPEDDAVRLFKMAMNSSGFIGRTMWPEMGDRPDNGNHEFVMQWKNYKEGRKKGMNASVLRENFEPSDLKKREGELFSNVSYVETDGGLLFRIENGKASRQTSWDRAINEGYDGSGDPKIKKISKEELQKYL